MPRKKKHPRIPTIAAIALTFSVSETSVWSAKRRFADFPQKRADGFDHDELDAFLERNRLWHYRTHGPNSGKASRDEMNEAKRQLAIEKSGRLRIVNERLRQRQRAELAEVIIRDDAVALQAEVKQTVLAVIDRRTAALTKLLEAEPTQENWAEMRAGLLAAFDGIPAEIHAEMLAKA